MEGWEPPAALASAFASVTGKVRKRYEQIVALAPRRPSCKKNAMGAVACAADFAAADFGFRAADFAADFVADFRAADFAADFAADPV